MSLQTKVNELVAKAKESQDPAELGKIYNELNEQVAKHVDEVTEDQKKLIGEVKADYEAKHNELETIIKNQGKKIEELTTDGNDGVIGAKQAVKEVKDLFDNVKKSFESKNYDEFTISTKALMNAYIATKADTLTTSVANSTLGLRDPEITRQANRRLTAYEAIPSKIRIPQNAGGTYRYFDQDSGTSVRAAAQIAEGAAFPESTIAWIERSIALVKTGEQVPYSDEFAYDYQQFMQELVWWLNTNVNIQVDDQIINGNGTAPNYSGILASIPAYVPVASGITDANIYDLIEKVAENITATEGSKYRPDLVMLNTTDIVGNEFGLHKDADNNYTDLQARTAAMGFTVIENNSLAANSMILGDSRYIHVIEDGLMTVKTGLYAGNDAIEGIERVLVSTRKNLLIKNLEQTGWREVTSISAALTTLAT